MKFPNVSIPSDNRRLRIKKTNNIALSNVRFINFCLLLSIDVYLLHFINTKLYIVIINHDIYKIMSGLYNNESIIFKHNNASIALLPPHPGQ